MVSVRQMTAGRYIRRGIISWLSLLLVASIAAHGAESDTTNNCEEIDASELRSPDSLWVARAFGGICDQGLMTSAAVVVELVREGAPSRKQTILSIDMPSKKSYWPKMKWDSTTRLVIELPSHAAIALQMAYYQGVQVEVRFCPSDPAIRAGWLEYKKSYRKWLTDSAAWAELKKRQPAATVPKPVQPEPPEALATDPTCLP